MSTSVLASSFLDYTVVFFRRNFLISLIGIEAELPRACVWAELFREARKSIYP